MRESVSIAYLEGGRLILNYRRRKFALIIDIVVLAVRKHMFIFISIVLFMVSVNAVC